MSPTADTSSIAALVANDGGDGISLREATAAANNTTGADAITFDASVFTSGDDNLIRLTQGELLISDSLSIDGNSVGSVLITGDANGDDITVNDANLTDVETASDLASDLIVDNSLVGDTTGSGITAVTGTGNILNQSALLGPLANNGGLTLTHALLSGSPAIGAGSNALALDENGNQLTTDQRGEDRFVETVDIGAVEFEDSFLLGDLDLNGEVDFDDIAQFISLLATNSFLNEADIDRDGEVTFDDIGPFITLLADGGSAQFSSNLTAPVLSSATVVMSEAAPQGTGRYQSGGLCKAVLSGSTARRSHSTSIH